MSCLVVNPFVLNSPFLYTLKTSGALGTNGLLDDSIVLNPFQSPFSISIRHYSMETEVGSSEQETSISGGENPRITFESCREYTCLYSYFQWYGYSRWPWISFVTTDDFSMRVNKKLLLDVSHLLTTCPSDLSHFSTQWNDCIMKSM